jgi:hypothetical protein
MNKQTVGAYALETFAFLCSFASSWLLLLMLAALRAPKLASYNRIANLPIQVREIAGGARKSCAP